MKTTLRWPLSLGLALASGLTGLSHAVAAVSSETNPAITIHVHNYAGVDPKTLAEAEKVAAGIFRKAGVNTQWVDTTLTGENNRLNSAAQPAITLADIQLSILPDDMSDRSGLPNNVMGLTPGTGPDRKIVYIFDSKVSTFFWGMLNAYGSRQVDRQVSKAQILGHAIAHELGHLLLNQQVHSAHGIMRGEWGFAEMRDAADGLLLFTPQQAEFLRADVRRRSTQQETTKVTEIESPAAAR
jgi:hypothetical protein